MSFISTSIPNLINGVSQQPPTLRRASQAELQENAYPSVVEGLKKRQPTKHIEVLDSLDLTDAHVHTINRDLNERYVVVTYFDSNAGQHTIRVFDVDGNEQTVNFSASRSYLDPGSASVRDSIKTMTVADFTFILNTNKTAAYTADLTSVRPPEGLVFCQQGNYGQTYQILINGTVKAEYITPDGSQSNHVKAISTSAIVDGLLNGTALNGASAPSSLAGTLNSNDWTFTSVPANGSTIYIRNENNNDFTLGTTSGQGGTSLKAIKDSIQRFSDLPVTAWPGFKVKIAGDQTSQFDDYYVSFEESNSATGEGVWKETIKDGIVYKLRGDLMPHSLVRESDGTFTFKEVSWGTRSVGDEASAEDPSFIGRKINDIFFHKNRLGLLADQNVIMSRAGKFFEFFPDTVTTVLDGDPIDVTASSTKVSILKHAVPWGQKLLLFSDQSQFILQGNPLLTPSTVSIDLVTGFESSSRTRPVVSGKNVFFAVDSGQFSNILEFFRDGTIDSHDANDITGHVPKYVAGKAFDMASSPNEDLLTVIGENEQDAIYNYKFFWEGNEKLQSAWSKWKFNGARLLGADFIGTELYLLMVRNGNLVLESMSVETGLADPNSEYLTHLDQKAPESDCSSAYNSTDNETTITLPYNVPVDEEVQVVTRAAADGSTTPGRLLKVVSRPGTSQVVVKGDASSTLFYVGTPYLMRYQFSQPVIREDSGNGSTVVGTGRLNVRFWTVHFDNTGYFELHVSPFYRGTSVYPYTGRVLGQKDNVIGAASISSGTFRAPVMAKNDEVTIELQSESFLPCFFQSVDWEALYFLRSRRA